jgi:putative transcriptional regulator
MNLHNYLKETRLKQNLTQDALARMVGVTRQTIIAIEKDKFVPSVKLALELSRALHVPIAELFCLQGEEGEGE